MFADQLRAAIEAAPRITLPAVTALLWRAYGDGQVTEAEAETLSALIEVRRLGSPKRADQRGADGSPDRGDQADAPKDRHSGPRRPGVGSRPRTDASIERRRRWAASGRLPPGLAARFTLAEQSVLSLVAAETARRGDCRLAVPHLAAVAGVAETTVRNAIREARKLGLVTVEERRVTGFRNLPNVVRIVSAEWSAWLRLARKGSTVTAPPSPRHHHHGDTHTPLARGGGCKSPRGTPTEVPVLCESRPAEPSKGCRGAASDPPRSDRARIRAGGGTGRAML